MDPVPFLHPPLAAIQSGGNRYNQRIIACADRQRFPLTALCVPLAGSPAEYHGLLSPLRSGGVLLWDSLLLSVYPRLMRPAGRIDAWLMHFLPSMNPRLSPAAATSARRMEDRAAAGGGLFLTTGQGLAKELQRRYPRCRVWVCEPGVDEVYATVGRNRLRPGSARKRVELLTVANLVSAKGYPELIAVLRHQLRADWCWHIVGSADADPVFASCFLSNVRDLLANGRIVFHGPLDPSPLADLMSHMDLYLSASHFESYGMALAEAVAAGLQVVTTEVGEAARIVTGACAGQCVPVGQWDAFGRSVAQAMAGVTAGSGHPADPGFRHRTWREAFDSFAGALRGLQEVALQQSPV